MRGKRAKQIRRLALSWAKAKGFLRDRNFSLRKFYRGMKKSYVRGELKLPKQK